MDKESIERLSLLNSHILPTPTQKTESKVDPQTNALRSVIKNFHKKPLQERLNQMHKVFPDLDTQML